MPGAKRISGRAARASRQVIIISDTFEPVRTASDEKAGLADHCSATTLEVAEDGDDLTGIQNAHVSSPSYTTVKALQSMRL